MGMSHENSLISYTNEIDFLFDECAAAVAVKIVLIAEKIAKQRFSFRNRKFEDKHIQLVSMVYLIFCIGTIEQVFFKKNIPFHRSAEIQ